MDCSDSKATKAGAELEEEEATQKEEPILQETCRERRTSG